jgi:RNA polymerase sigma factor for flagellar operon FliA
VAAPREIDAIWRRYLDTRDQRACERLILAYAPLVKYVAGRLGGRLPAHVDGEDLVQWGLEGLLSAITRFDPSLGNKFETFAISHIRGKMIDELRRMDFAPRSLRARAREVERAMQELEGRLGRPPSDDEVAAALGVPVEDFRSLLGDIARASVAALDELWPGGTGEGDTLSLLDTLEDPNAEDPTRALGMGERREALFEGVQRLPDREKLVITLYYFEELTLREIGEVLRVTESRVSQLHTKALLRLRGYLASQI